MAVAMVMIVAMAVAVAIAKMMSQWDDVYAQYDLLCLDALVL